MIHIRDAGETFGNACAEFSHLGKPVVSTYAGACAHRVILHQSPSFVVVNDALELETAVRAVPFASALLQAATVEASPSGSVTRAGSLSSSLPGGASSPYAAFSPAKVTRRLLELCLVAMATKRHRPLRSTEALLSITSPRSGSIAPSEVALDASLETNLDTSSLLYVSKNGDKWSGWPA